MYMLIAGRMVRIGKKETGWLRLMAALFLHFF